MKAIVCVDSNFGIGLGGAMPWGIHKEDMAFFRGITAGQSLIMGRKTYEGIPNELPGREVKVLTGDKNYVPKFSKDVTLNPSDTPFNPYYFINDFVCGGKSVYDFFIPFCEGVFVTYLSDSWISDTKFNVDLLSCFNDFVVLKRGKDYRIVYYFDNQNLRKVL